MRPPCPPSARARPSARVRLPGRGLTLAVLCLQLGGCLALSLRSRGVSEERWRQIDLSLQPLDLPPSHGDHHTAMYVPEPLWVTVPESGGLHGYDTQLVDASGDSVPTAVLHHYKVMVPHLRELFSPVMLHLAGGGSETKPVSLPKQAGVHMEEGDSILVTAMLHNPTMQDLKGVQLKITLHYSPEGPWEAPLSVVPFFTHVTPAMSEPAYDLPPGRSQRSLEITPVVSGWLIGLGGHLHRYGIALQLEDVETGEILWRKEPHKAEDGTVLEVPHDRFTWSRGPRLAAARAYRVTAIYDNPTGEVIAEGGMGTVGGAFVPEEPWPEVDREAAEYVWYREREVTGLGRFVPTAGDSSLLTPRP